MAQCSLLVLIWCFLDLEKRKMSVRAGWGSGDLNFRCFWFSCLRHSEYVVSLIVVLIFCLMMLWWLAADCLCSCNFLGPFITWWSNNAEGDNIQVIHAALPCRQNNTERNQLISAFMLLQANSIQNAPWVRSEKLYKYHLACVVLPFISL